MIQALLNRLIAIEKELEEIGSVHADLFASYTGTDFPEQKELAENFLDNLILAATHETASALGFYRKDIETLSKFIIFRCQFKELTDDELCCIIDDINCDLHFRAMLKKRLSIESITEYISNLRNDWNKHFDNNAYSVIRSGIYKYSYRKER